MKEVTKRNIQNELDKKLIIATTDDVLKMKPRFSLASEIYYNDNAKDNEESRLPKIKQGKRKIHWDTLGQEVMTYEGFIIEIKIYDPTLYEINKKYVVKK